MRTNITGVYGVPGKNKGGRRVVEFWAESGLFVGNTYFEHMSLNMYTTLPRCQDGVEVKRTKDLVLMKKDMLCYMQDVRTDHVVLCKVRLVGAWIRRRKEMVEDMRIRTEKLRDH